MSCQKTFNPGDRTRFESEPTCRIQVGCEGMALRHREVVGNGQQPGKKIKRAGEDGGVIGQTDLHKL